MIRLFKEEVLLYQITSVLSSYLKFVEDISFPLISLKIRFLLITYSMYLIENFQRTSLFYITCSSCVSSFMHISAKFYIYNCQNLWSFYSLNIEY